MLISHMLAYQIAIDIVGDILNGTGKSTVRLQTSAGTHEYGTWSRHIAYSLVMLPPHMITAINPQATVGHCCQIRKAINGAVAVILNMPKPG